MVRARAIRHADRVRVPTRAGIALVHDQVVITSEEVSGREACNACANDSDSHLSHPRLICLCWFTRRNMGWVLFHTRKAAIRLTGNERDTRHEPLSEGWATRQLSDFLTLVSSFDDERSATSALSSAPSRCSTPTPRRSSSATSWPSRRAAWRTRSTSPRFAPSPRAGRSSIRSSAATPVPALRAEAGEQQRPHPRHRPRRARVRAAPRSTSAADSAGSSPWAAERSASSTTSGACERAPRPRPPRTHGSSRRFATAR